MKFNNKKLAVFSEIGRLKTVVVHRPGEEVTRLAPQYFSRMLFDDTMYLPVAQKEHDAFTSILRNEGVEVLYIEKLLADVFDQNPTLKYKFLKEFLKEANVRNKNLVSVLTTHFKRFKDSLSFVQATMAGVMKNEISLPDKSRDLETLCVRNSNYPFYLDPIPNILMQRDPFTVVYNGMNINRMWAVTRRRETLYYKYLHNYHPRFKGAHLSFDRTALTTMEGGDILVISPKMLFVAISERTVPASIDAWSKKLFAEYPELKRVVAFNIPKGHATMHLDTVITHVDHNVFLMDAKMHGENYEVYEISRDSKYPKNLYGKMEDILFRLLGTKVKVVLVGGADPLYAESEQWTDGANSLTIKPGEIITYDRNVFTNKELVKAGIKVHVFPGSELSRARGGPRCLSMPLVRAPWEYRPKKTS